MAAKFKIPLALAMVAVILITMAYAWLMQSGAGRTCDYHLEPQTGSNFSYLQIELQRQDPIEPVFFGKLLYLLNQDPRVSSLGILTTSAQGYGDTIIEGSVTTNGNGQFFVGPISGYAINPTSGSHRLFPFDSAHFDFTVKTVPRVSFSFFTVINRVDGFVLDCDSVSASRVIDGRTHVSFTFRRNPLIQLCAIVIVAASIAFAILIVRSTTTEALAGAAASSFFTLWSVRSILSSQIHVFPTILDLIVLTASIVLLTVVIWRVVFNTMTRSVSAGLEKGVLQVGRKRGRS